MTALLFAYGSLVGRESAARTLGEPPELIATARLRGLRRAWSTLRDNLESEKTFAPADGGEPFRHCLGLNLEPATRAPEPNGALLRLTGAQLERLDLRELRYERIDVTGMVDPAPRGGERVEAYVARPGHRCADPPPGTVLLASYLAAVEAAFAELGPVELERFRETTAPPPVAAVEGVLVADRIPPGNPRAW